MVEAGEAAVHRITKVKTAIGAIIRLIAMTNQNLNHHGETILTMSPLNPRHLGSINNSVNPQDQNG